MCSVSEVKSIYKGTCNYYLDEKVLNEYLNGLSPIIVGRVEQLYASFLLTEPPMTSKALIIVGDSQAIDLRPKDTSVYLPHIDPLIPKGGIVSPLPLLDHVLIANLVRKKLSFCYSGILLDPQIEHFFDFLKQNGYRLCLVHVFSENNNEQMKDLSSRIDTFIKYAEQISFYYNNKKSLTKAATWSNIEDCPELDILNNKAYEKLKTAHNEAVGNPLLHWEKTVEKNVLIML